MAQLSINVPDEMAEWLKSRVTAYITVTDQVNDALEDYRKEAARRESKQVKAAP